MLELKNVSKIYRTKTKSDVYALNDVNITFPKSGMYLINGKSGCGKTTLLNIIGGLDLDFQGEYYIDNKLLKTTSDFDNFRRTKISFIFQDYNLVDDLNVKENLELGYKFTGQSSDEKIGEVLKKVGLEGYENRFPKELSGGEQQRIAVARALLKNAPILLADEPTGNLDKNNSIEICKLLKEIAQDKLVIMVSHDEELSKAFSDSIIKLEKGHIVASVNVVSSTNITNDENNEKFKNVISNKVAFKMALHEFGYKKIKTIVTIIVMTICFSLLSVSLATYLYLHCDPYIEMIKRENYQYLKMTLNYEGLKELKKDNVAFIKTNNGKQNFITDKKELDRMGVKWLAVDETITSPLLKGVDIFSSEELKFLFHSGYSIKKDGKSYYIDDQFTAWEKIIGADVINSKNKHVVYIGGVYQSPIPYVSYDDTYFYKEKVSAQEGIKYFLATYEDGFYNARTTYNTFENPINSYGIFQKKLYSNDKNILNFDIYISNEETNKCYTILDDGRVLDLIPRDNANDEVYISLSMYNRLFNTNYNSSDVIKKTSDENKNTKVEVLKNFDKMGENITLYLEKKSNEESYYIGEFKIKGVICYDDDLHMKEYITLNEEMFYKYVYIEENPYVVINLKSVGNLKKFLTKYHNEYEGEFKTPIDTVVKDFENGLYNLKVIITLVSIAMAVILVLLVGTLLSGKVIERQKVIGIFKSLGASNLDITKIYFYEVLLMAIPVMVVSIIISYFTIKGIDYFLINQMVESISFFKYKLLGIPLIIAITLILIFVSILLPLRRIEKISVIEVIRNS